MTTDKGRSDGGKAMDPIYPWRRYWVHRDALIDLGDHGFLVDPESEQGKYSAQRLYTLADLQHFPVLVLLGEPGIGKSVTLQTEFEGLRAHITEGQSVQKYVDLRSFSSDLLFHQRVFGSPDFLDWKAGNAELTLFLDSLDEALLRIDTVAALLADEFPQHPTTRMSVRIACRTFVWPHDPLETAFTRIWGEEAVGVFELAPLRRRDVADAAVQRGIDPERFIKAVENADAVPFAIKPLTLNLLFRLYERDGSLPNRRVDLYTQGCLSLCEEHSGNRRGAGRLGLLNIHQRYRLVGRIAAVTMLANRYAVWTDAVTEAMPNEDVSLPAIAVGKETGDFQPFDVTDANLRDVLDTGLFSSRGAARIGWAHQSYAEFLAADYLVTKQTAPENILKILCHPSGGLIPQLWMVAAWVASRNAELRHLLIAQEPFTLLRGDLFSWTAEDLEALTAALLAAFQQQRAHDFSPGIANDYRKLTHPALAGQLRPYIIDAGKHVIARRAALMIARACSLHELQPELLVVALDPADDPSIRGNAVSALETCGDEAARVQLLPLARGALGPDPNDEIKGRALRQLWPNHLTSEEMFQLITPPADGFVGAYVMFVTRDLPRSLAGADLIAALRWATEYARSASQTDEFTVKQLADALMVQSWKYTDIPEVMEAFVAYVNVVLHRSHQLFMSNLGREDEEFKQQVREDVTRRRQVLLKALSTTETVESYDGFLFLRAGFLDKGDLEWLLSICPAGRAPLPDLNTASLCALIGAVFDFWNPSDFETIYDIAVAWEPLHEQYRWLIDGIPLDSPDTDRMREHHRLSLELEDRRSVPVDPPPAERIRLGLDKFDAGELSAWWILNLDLTLTPTSTHYEPLQHRITKTPGWIAADGQTRQRILRTAQRFLERAESQAHTWLGTTSYTHSDFSAYRALILLQELEPTVYQGLGGAIWQKWASVVSSGAAH